MPEDMEFLDIRRGSDVEFGQSIYEPFGIAPLEPLTFGAICVLSGVSGCCGLVEEAIEGIEPASSEGTRNVIVADYTAIDGWQSDAGQLLGIDRNVRDQVEAKVSSDVADEIIRLLPKTESEIEAMIETGYAIAKNMSWDIVVGKYILPSIENVPNKQQLENIRAVV